MTVITTQTINTPNLLNTGIQHFQGGNFSGALQFAEHILGAERNNADALHLKAASLMRLGRLDEARKFARKALKYASKNPSFIATFAAILQEQKLYPLAIKEYQKALRLSPNASHAHHNLGQCYLAAGNIEQSAQCYQKLLKIAPDDFFAHSNLGKYFAEKRVLDKACSHYLAAYNQRPSDAAICANLAAIFYELSNFEKALGYYEQAVQLNPNDVDVRYRYSVTLYECGQCEEAVTVMKQLYRDYPTPGLLVSSVMMIPHLMESHEQIAQVRQKLEADIDALTAAKITLQHPETSTPRLPFYQIYHGMDDKPILIKLANFFEQACPSLLYEAPHCTTPPEWDGQRKIKIGFISKFLALPAVQALLKKWLATELLDITVLQYRNENADTHNFIEENQLRLLPLSDNLHEARMQIAKEELDIMFYFDIGMDVYSYLLSFARLAPFQVGCGGHPDTSGVRNVDYFLGRKHQIEPWMQDQYTEKLIFLDFFTNLKKDTVPNPVMPRAELGLPEDKTLYVCPMFLQKLHPDFDHAVAEILRQDDNAEIIFFTMWDYTGRDQKVLERFRRNFPDVVERIRFLEHAPLEKFKSILLACDAVLETFPFGGGRTIYLAFALGIPIVSMIGKYFYGRGSYCCYKRMQVEGPLANNVEEYIQTAIRTANDKVYREDLSSQILKQNHLLFEEEKDGYLMLDFFKDLMLGKTEF